ncbi:glycine cleavage system pyridoxal-binding protein P [Paraburkholderia caballeronis]|uniref:aminomethyl-transferring glycine dehydrogenase subunit GcvPA n=1 Tax=Paraburkholderia caballeronis TaxID=416943 RepID=UPI0010669CC2|nr:aminomethyl-transferring glycine dehydrogenase subunit GcvPA [Paraburkholderia caballeronis]TDV33600.1 glycine cleavage system pyridoxal-binding protein P [Paraburkholderia caballeronis]
MTIQPHPFMPNSVESVQRDMLDAIGAPDIGSLFAQIPADHRLQRPLQLDPALPAESALRRHLIDILQQNRHCTDQLSFLGGGCWQHHVPAICDEIVRRSEFLTSVWGTPSSDHGRYQAWFEFCSQLGELVDCDLVGLPVYTWGCAAGHALRLASRLNGRREVLVPEGLDPERLLVIRNYCEPPQMPNHLRIVPIRYDRASGRLDLADLAARIGPQTAAVYLETPNYFGIVEQDAPRIAELAHAAGAEMIVGVDPLSLGVLAAPPAYGADIVVGTTQPLGVHMHGGGGLGGFIASRDEERYAREYPTLLVSLTDTVRAGERGFGLSLAEQSSYGSREHGKDWTGNSVYLWAIANAVYLSLMGPRGFEEVGELLVAQANYAARRLATLPGVAVPFSGQFFKEFVVDFSATGRSVDSINAALRAHGIFGGHDLSAEFPELGQRALYCVTELHRKQDIDRLVDTLTGILSHDH